MKKLILISILVLVFVPLSSVVAAEQLIFLSTQFNPVSEMQFITEEVLSGFTNETGIKVEFVPVQYADFVNRILAEVKTGRVVQM